MKDYNNQELLQLEQMSKKELIKYFFDKNEIDYRKACEYWIEEGTFDTDLLKFLDSKEMIIRLIKGLEEKQLSIHVI